MLAVTPAFISHDPRPYSFPPRMTPLHGDSDQSDSLPVGTTSMCPFRMSERGRDPPAEPPVPVQRPTTLRRSRNGTPSSQKAGWSFTSSHSDLITSAPSPSERSLSATKCCAFCSCPGRLGIWTSRCRNATSSSQTVSTHAAIFWVRSGIEKRSSAREGIFRLRASLKSCHSEAERSGGRKTLLFVAKTPNLSVNTPQHRWVPESQRDIVHLQPARVRPSPAELPPPMCGKRSPLHHRWAAPVEPLRKTR